MRVLITGGAGYIGSELTGFLLDAGHEVHVVDKLMYEPTSLIRYTNNPRFHFYKVDMLISDSWHSLVKKADCIIPLAALVGFPLCEERRTEAQLINYLTNKVIADMKRPEQMLIYPSTNSGYGTTDGTSVCTEETALRPVSKYGITKLLAEKAYQDTEGCITLRLATVFGPSTRPRTDLLVNNFVLRAVNDGFLVLYESSFMRNYVHIHDICRAFMFLIDNWDSCKNETYNVGNDEINMSKRQLADKIAKYVPLEIIQAEFTQDPDKRNYIVSSQKLYDKGFECKYDLDVGIKQLLVQYSMLTEPWYANY